MKFIKIIYIQIRFILIALHKAKSLNNFFFYYKTLNDYRKLNNDFNNKELKIKIINNLYNLKVSPSDFSNLLHFRHSDLEYERFKIYKNTTLILDKLKKLDQKTINFFNEKFQNKSKVVCLYSQSISFLAFNINLSTIYSFFGIKCKVFFYHDELALDTRQVNKINKEKLHIIKSELAKVQKLIKNIKIIYVDENEKKIIPKNVKEIVKVCTVRDLLSYIRIFTFKDNVNYNQLRNEVKNNKDLKLRYLEHLDFTKKIFSLINKEDYWIIHNSNVGKSGIIQEIVNLKNCKFSSHEFATRLKLAPAGNDLIYKDNLPKIYFSKNNEVLKFNFEDEMKYFLKNNANEEKINLGSTLIKNNFNKYFNINEENIFFSKFPNLKSVNKDKIFLLLSNVLWESRFSLKEHHTIFNNFKEFLIETMSFFKDSNAKLIIKGHPMEKAKNDYDDSLESVYQIHKNKNVHLINSNEISSYSLSNITKNIIVYDTDMGAEMVFKNKRVLTCGKAQYKDFNISFFPKNKLEYFKTLQDLCSNEIVNSKLFRINQRNAALFWYFFNFNIFKDFGFTYGDSTNQTLKNFDFIFSKESYSKKDYENPITDML